MTNPTYYKEDGLTLEDYHAALLADFRTNSNAWHPMFREKWFEERIGRLMTLLQAEKERALEEVRGQIEELQQQIGSAGEKLDSKIQDMTWHEYNFATKNEAVEAVRLSIIETELIDRILALFPLTQTK